MLTTTKRQPYECALAESWISEWRALDRRHRAHHVSYVPTHAATGGRRDRTNTRSHGHYCVRPTVPPTSTISECSEAAGAIGGPSTALWGEVGLTAGLTFGGSWAHSLFLVWFEALGVGYRCRVRNTQTFC